MFYTTVDTPIHDSKRSESFAASIGDIGSDVPLGKPLKHLEGEVEVWQSSSLWFSSKWKRRFLIVLGDKLEVYTNRQDCRNRSNVLDTISLLDANIYEQNIHNPPKGYDVHSGCCVELKSDTLTFVTQDIRRWVNGLKTVKNVAARQFRAALYRGVVASEPKGEAAQDENAGESFSMDIIRFDGSITQQAFGVDVTCGDLLKKVIAPLPRYHPLEGRMKGLAELWAVDKTGNDFKVDAGAVIHQLWVQSHQFFILEHAYKLMVISFPDGSFEARPVLPFVTTAEVLRMVVFQNRLAILGIVNAGLFFRDKNGREEPFANDEKPLKRLYDHKTGVKKKTEIQGRFTMRNKNRPTQKLIEVEDRDRRGVKIAYERGCLKDDDFRQKAALAKVYERKRAAPAESPSVVPFNESEKEISVSNYDFSKLQRRQPLENQDENTALPMEADSSSSQVPRIQAIASNEESPVSLPAESETTLSEKAVEVFHRDKNHNTEAVSNHKVYPDIVMDLTMSRISPIREQEVSHPVNDEGNETLNRTLVADHDPNTPGSSDSDKWTVDVVLSKETDLSSTETSFQTAEDGHNALDFPEVETNDTPASSADKNLKNKPTKDSTVSTSNARSDEMSSGSVSVSANGTEVAAIAESLVSVCNAKVNGDSEGSDAVADVNTEVNVDVVNTDVVYTNTEIMVASAIGNHHSHTAKERRNTESDSSDEEWIVEEFMDSIEPPKSSTVIPSSDNEHETPMSERTEEKVVVETSVPDTTYVNEDKIGPDEKKTIEQGQQLKKKYRASLRAKTKCVKCNSLASGRPFLVVSGRLLDYVRRECTKKLGNAYEPNPVDYICLSGVHLRNTAGEWEITDDTVASDTETMSGSTDVSLPDSCFGDGLAVAIKRYRLGKYLCTFYPSSQTGAKGRWLVKCNTEANQEYDRDSNSGTPVGSESEAESSSRLSFDVSGEAMENNNENQSMNVLEEDFLTVDHSKDEFTVSDVVSELEIEERRLSEDIVIVTKKIVEKLNNALISTPKNLREAILTRPTDPFMPTDLVKLRIDLTEQMKRAINQIHGHFAAASTLEGFMSLGDDKKAPPIGDIMRVNFCKAFEGILSTGFRSRGMSLQFLFGRPMALNLWSLMKAVGDTIDNPEMENILKFVADSEYAEGNEERFRLAVTELLSKDNLEEQERLLMTWFRKFRTSDQIIRKYYVPGSLWCSQSSLTASHLIEELSTQIESVCHFPYTLHADFERSYMKTLPKADQEDGFSFEREAAEEEQDVFCFE